MMEHADFPEDGCADYPHCVYVCVGGWGGDAIEIRDNVQQSTVGRRAIHNTYDTHSLNWGMMQFNMSTVQGWGMLACDHHTCS